MTNRNRAPQASDRSPGRVIAPLVFVTTTLLAAGCFQPQVVGDPAAAKAKAEARRVLRSGASATLVGSSLGEEDPQLKMDAVTGAAVPEVGVVSIQVLPAGNVAAKTVAIPVPDRVVPTTVTRWVKTTTATNLWSGSDAQALAFTNLPEASFLRAAGPAIRAITGRGQYVVRVGGCAGESGEV